jgi:hypothetical protein
MPKRLSHSLSSAILKMLVATCYSFSTVAIQSMHKAG